MHPAPQGRDGETGVWKKYSLGRIVFIGRSLLKAQNPVDHLFASPPQGREKCMRMPVQAFGILFSWLSALCTCKDPCNTVQYLIVSFQSSMGKLPPLWSCKDFNIKACGEMIAFGLNCMWLHFLTLYTHWQSAAKASLWEYFLSTNISGQVHSMAGQDMPPRNDRYPAGLVIQGVFWILQEGPQVRLTTGVIHAA